MSELIETGAPDRVVATLDARPLLASGVHPVSQVMSALAVLGPGDAFVLVTPFVPGPLLEKAKAFGCEGHSEEAGPGEVRTVFVKRVAAATA